MKSLLKPDAIFHSSEIYTKKRVLEKLSELLAHDKGLNSARILQQFIARERLGSTGLGHGVALPHIRFAEIHSAKAALIVLDNPVDFDSPDEQRVDILLGLVVPDASPAANLSLMAELAEMFDRRTFRDKIRVLKHSTNLLYQLFNNTLSILCET